MNPMKTILIVEGQPQVATLMKCVLKLEGYNGTSSRF